jgi:hypothetical protein
MTDWNLNRATLRLSSGPHRLAAELSGSGEGDGPFMVGAVLSEGNSVLGNFGLTGRLSMRLRGRTVALDAVDEGERAAVRRFLELCHVDRPHEPPLPWQTAEPGRAEKAPPAPRR